MRISSVAGGLNAFPLRSPSPSLVADVGGVIFPPQIEEPKTPLALSLEAPTESERVPGMHAQHQSFGHRVMVVIVVLLPAIGVVAAGLYTWGYGLDWLSLALFVGMYIATGLGITVGYHRLFTHRSFETGRFMTWVWAVLGSMASEGPVIQWCGMHRMHHQHSDKELDPHSPHQHGGDTAWSAVKGAFHAHMGWLFASNPPGLARYVKDLRADPIVLAVSRQFVFWVLVGLALPAVIGGLVTMSWTGALLGFIWGGLVRMFMVHHVTWSINSVCHIWGGRTYESHDESRNNLIFGVLAFGEGWHNNHHAFPASARHGLKWWQFDSSYLLIKAMQKVGLVSKVRVPTPDRLKAKEARPTQPAADSTAPHSS